MNWEAIGAIGEIVGAIAVVVTLGYLALQIRQQIATTNLQLHESCLGGFDEPNALLAEDAGRAAMFNRGLDDPDNLSDEEAAQFSALFRLFMNQYLKIHRLYVAGILSGSEWTNYARTGAYFIGTPGGRRWCETQHAFADFVAALQEIPNSENALNYSLGRGR